MNSKVLWGGGTENTRDKVVTVTSLSNTRTENIKLKKIMKKFGV